MEDCCHTHTSDRKQDQSASWQVASRVLSTHVPVTRRMMMRRKADAGDEDEEDEKDGDDDDVT